MVTHIIHCFIIISLLFILLIISLFERKESLFLSHGLCFSFLGFGVSSLWLISYVPFKKVLLF